MGINDCIILVVVGFFGLVLYSIHKDEQRRADRRQQDLPHPIERRRRDRRRKSPYAYLAWALRSQWSKLKNGGHP
jgi:hypothetical protein